MLCSSVNFFAGDRIVFARRSIASFCVAAGLLVSHPATTLGASSEADSVLVVAGPSAAAVAAWDKYVAAVDARHSQASPKDFFALDMQRAGTWRERAKSGNVPMVDVDPPGAPDAKIHHWVGAIYVPNTSVDAVVKRLQDYAGRESEFYTEVKASKLIERRGQHRQGLPAAGTWRLRRLGDAQYRTHGRLPPIRTDTRGQPLGRDQDRRAAERGPPERKRADARQRSGLPLAAERILAVRAGGRRCVDRVRVGVAQPGSAAARACVHLEGD